MGREPDVYVARDSFTAPVDGIDANFVKGVTLVRAGHPLLDAYPDLFEPVRVHYEVEEATAAPGSRRAR